MAESRRKLVDRFTKYWLGNRGIGLKPRLWTLVDWITLYPLRKLLVSLAVASFRFRKPAWVNNVNQVVYRADSRIRWHDYLNPIYWSLWTLTFVYQWLLSRPYLTLGPAVPAMLLGLGLSVFAVRQMIESSDWRGNTYRRILATAVQTEDDNLTQLALTNLINWYPENIDLRIQQALLAEKLEKSDSASKIMMSLVSSRRNAYAAAWLIAKRFPNPENSKDWTAQDHRDFNALMAVWIEGSKGAEEVRAQTWMANYSIGIGSLSDALRNIEPAAAKNSDLLLLTARLHAQLGQVEPTRQWGERARQYYEARLLKAPSDIQVRVNLATALILLAREAEAVQVLEDGYRLTNDPAMLQASGEALATQAMRIQKTEPLTEESLYKRLQLIQRSLRAAPKSALVLETLTQVIIESSDKSSAEFSNLRKEVLRGIEPETMHFIQGTVYLMRGNLQKADVHLEIASKSSSNLPGVLNNMAVVLYQREKPDLVRALQLSEAAVARMPDHPYIRETRGQILVKLKQYPKAILDLEAALVAPELAPAAHAALATAYAGLGQTDLAQEHQAQSSVKNAATKKID